MTIIRITYNNVNVCYSSPRQKQVSAQLHFLGLELSRTWMVMSLEHAATFFSPHEQFNL